LVGSAVLAIGTKEYPVDLRGIDPPRQDRVTPISHYVTQGSYRLLSSQPDGILLGSGVAGKMGAKVDEVVVVGSALGEKMSLKVVGIFDSGIPPVDNTRVYVALHNAQTLLGKPDVVGRIEIRLADPD